MHLTSNCHFRQSTNLHFLQRFTIAWHGFDDVGYIFVWQVVERSCSVVYSRPSRISTAWLKHHLSYE